ncbi:peptidyl-tRNA hydrolase [Goodfellowiella coeruleoviolacea]|uniref:peptidyl-tRNA hydrolase n=1 Tax=Goodfellowiella coeruleoviolacea TaxID=334858 RepID=A0AAE3KJN0_9PSEU|nr:peptidyl-tRNA hydrolase [Goodfellowiella coeruleoviolacea]MCP2170391.1 Peptidyl-tRNA hydrolase [Goodfellowiella coeruleoviolacea]
MTHVLDPLAWRHSGARHPAEEDPEQVRAMPVVLRVERDTPPGRTPLLEAAAAAAVAVCLDPRAEPGGEWHEPVLAWTSGRIRKIARRARGAHWRAVQDLPGITVEVAGAQARALLPGLVSATPREVSRLQISGSELPADQPGPPPAGVPVLWLNPTVPMTAGKAAAQVGHASMLLAARLHEIGAGQALADWAETGFRCAVRTPSPAEWGRLYSADNPGLAWTEHQVVAVHDAGFTEVAPNTVTVLGQWPAAAVAGTR